MKILDKIKSLFVKKEGESNKNSGMNSGQPAVPVADVKTTEPKPEKKPFSVTEASLCRTSYGLGKLREDGEKRFLIFPEKIEVRYIPFVENNCIEAVYIINPESLSRDERGRYIYEIIESVQFFMLSREQKDEIASDLGKRGIQYKFPEEIDNYSTVMNVLRESDLLMRNQDSDWFEKERFLSEISEIKGSNSYKELHLIRMKDGRRFILIVNQIIPNVIEYSPSFMNIYEPGAVKISYMEGYAFIAPFGKPR